MSEQLPAPDFDSQNYTRPNDRWICGRACEGKACRLGPDNHGRCGAGPECVPVTSWSRSTRTTCGADPCSSRNGSKQGLRSS